MMIVRTIIEIPQGSQNKYEYDMATGTMRLDRVLHGAMHYPVNYGFIPKTWAEDQDPLDILVFGSTALLPGIEVAVRVVGALWMEDEHGIDHKIVGVVDTDPRFGHVRRAEDLGPHRLHEIRHFFQEYKALQGLLTKVGNFHDASTAENLINECRDRFNETMRGGGNDDVPGSHS